MKLFIILLTLFSISWCDETPTIEMFFLKFGEYEFINENGHSVVKSYYSARTLNLNWMEAFLTCKAFDMDLVELPSEAENNHFLALCEKHHSELLGNHHLIGGSYAGKGLYEWYWMTTGQRVNYTLKYVPGEPNNWQGNEKFLLLDKVGQKFMYRDIGIPHALNFICQRITNASIEIVDPILALLPHCNPATVEWLPHPVSCNKFVLCFHGTPIQKSCATNLRFNAEKGKCISSQLPCCPQEDDAMNPVFLANINDCSKYYVCFSGKAIERSCDKGLFFDVTSNLCTFPENLICGSRPIIAPIMGEVKTIDTSICKWYGTVNRESGSYIKSLCYYDKQATHEEASNVCHKHGMRLMRIEDKSVQTATFAYLSDMFVKRSNGVYHISGTHINRSWYHDKNTPVSDNLQWKDGKKPVSGCLALSAFNPFIIESFICTKQLHSICEFNY